MKSSNAQFVIIFSLCLFVLLVPFVFAMAQGTDKGLQNPTKFPTVEKLIEGVLRAVVYIAMPVIALFMVYAGFLFVKARGSSDGITKARENFLYVVIGAILILGAWVFATLIGGTVSQLVG